MGKKKTAKKRNAAAFLLQVVMAVALIYMLDKMRQAFEIDPWWVILFLFLSIFICINLHELGHFVLGKLAGYRLLAFQIGFLHWGKENDKMRFSFRRAKGFGGYCAMIPPGASLPIVKHKLYYAGGILSNILTGAVFLLLLISAIICSIRVIRVRLLCLTPLSLW